MALVLLSSQLQKYFWDRNAIPTINNSTQKTKLRKECLVYWAAPWKIHHKIIWKKGRCCKFLQLHCKLPFLRRKALVAFTHLTRLTRRDASSMFHPKFEQQNWHDTSQNWRSAFGVSREKDTCADSWDQLTFVADSRASCSTEKKWNRGYLLGCQHPKNPTKIVWFTLRRTKRNRNVLLRKQASEAQNVVISQSGWKRQTKLSLLSSEETSYASCTTRTCWLHVRQKESSLIDKTIDKGDWKESERTTKVMEMKWRENKSEKHSQKEGQKQWTEETDFLLRIFHKTSFFPRRGCEKNSRCSNKSPYHRHKFCIAQLMNCPCSRKGCALPRSIHRHKTIGQNKNPWALNSPHLPPAFIAGMWPVALWVGTSHHEITCYWLYFPLPSSPLKFAQKQMDRHHSEENHLLPLQMLELVRVQFTKSRAKFSHSLTLQSEHISVMWFNLTSVFFKDKLVLILRVSLDIFAELFLSKCFNLLVLSKQYIEQWHKYKESESYHIKISPPWAQQPEVFPFCCQNPPFSPWAFFDTNITTKPQMYFPNLLQFFDATSLLPGWNSQTGRVRIVDPRTWLRAVETQWGLRPTSVFRTLVKTRQILDKHMCETHKEVQHSSYPARFHEPRWWSGTFTQGWRWPADIQTHGILTTSHRENTMKRPGTLCHTQENFALDTDNETSKITCLSVLFFLAQRMQPQTAKFQKSFRRHVANILSCRHAHFVTKTRMTSSSARWTEAGGSGAPQGSWFFSSEAETSSTTSVTFWWSERALPRRVSDSPPGNGNQILPVSKHVETEMQWVGSRAWKELGIGGMLTSFLQNGWFFFVSVFDQKLVSEQWFFFEQLGFLSTYSPGKEISQKFQGLNLGLPSRWYGEALGIPVGFFHLQSCARWITQRGFFPAFNRCASTCFSSADSLQKTVSHFVLLSPCFGQCRNFTNLATILGCGDYVDPLSCPRL